MTLMGGAGFEPAKALASGFTAHPDCPLRHPPALEGTYSIDRFADDQHNPTAIGAPGFISPPPHQSECGAGGRYGALKRRLPIRPDPRRIESGAAVPESAQKCAAGGRYGALKLTLWLLFRRLVLFGHLEISILEARRHDAGQQGVAVLAGERFRLLPRPGRDHRLERRSRPSYDSIYTASKGGSASCGERSSSSACAFCWASSPP